jgi:hypothetical protein
MQGDWLWPTGALARLVHDALPALAFRPPDGRTVRHYENKVKPKRKKPFEAEWALLRELGLA